MATISTSRAPLVTGTTVTRKNLIRNPVPTSMTDYVPTRATGTWGSASGGYIRLVSTVAYPAGGVRFDLNVGAARPAAVPGLLYSASVDSFSETNTRSVVRILFYDGAGLFIAGNDRASAPFNGTTAWQRGSVSAIAPAGTASIALALESGDAMVIGDNLYWRRVRVNAGTDTDFFSGSSPAAGPIDYAWLGAANLSVSVERLSTYDTVTDTTPELVLGYESTRRSRNKVHEILGGGTVVSLGESGLRTGRLELFYLTEQAAVDAELMHSKPAVFTLATPDTPTTAMTYTLADGGSIVRTLDAETRTRWVVAVDFQEVAA